MVRGYGAKYGTDEVELFFNDSALALDETGFAGPVFDDTHGNYQGLDQQEHDKAEKADEDFDPAVLEQEELRAGQIYLPVSGGQIRRVNEAINNAGLGDASLTFEQKLKYLEGQTGERYRH